MKGSFVPGPWIAVHDAISEDGPLIVDREGNAFAQVYGHNLKTSMTANLIAAAPEMLEAMHVFLQCHTISSVPRDQEIARAMQELIAKIEGGT